MMVLVSSVRSISLARSPQKCIKALAAEAMVYPSRRSPLRPSTRVSPSAPRFLRCPVEMSSCAVGSLLPMHSAAASTLMTSLLSTSFRGYRFLAKAGDDDV